MTVFYIPKMDLKLHKLLMLHCQKIEHLYLVNISNTIRDLLWQNILQNTHVSTAIMIYSNQNLAQGYKILQKGINQQIHDFNHVQLIQI